MEYFTEYKVLAYTILFTALTVGGSVFAGIMNFTGIPQYACNIIFGLLITLYVFENQVMFYDLEECKIRLRKKELYLETIKDLTASNKTLQQQNTKLTEEMKLLTEMKTLYQPNENTTRKSILKIKDAWVLYCDSERMNSPPRIFESPEKNMERKCTTN